METFLIVAIAAITAASNIWAAYETRQANFHYAEGNRIAAGGEPMPNQPKPSYKPMIVMAILTLLTWSAVGYDIYDRRRSSELSFGPDYVAQDAPKHEWRNEEVPLDGFRYDNCEMWHVTFRYEGRTPIQLSNSTIHGFNIASENPALANQLLLLAAMHAVSPDIQIVTPPGWRIDIPHRELR